MVKVNINHFWGKNALENAFFMENKIFYYFYIVLLLYTQFFNLK